MRRSADRLGREVRARREGALARVWSAARLRAAPAGRRRRARRAPRRALGAHSRSFGAAQRRGGDDGAQHPRRRPDRGRAAGGGAAGSTPSAAASGGGRRRAPAKASRQRPISCSSGSGSSPVRCGASAANSGEPAAASASSVSARSARACAVLEHRELRRDAGLEREAAQQRVAEGVDRLDLQPARRLERAGEQRAGAVEPVGRIVGARLAERGQRGAQLGLGHHRPGAEGAEEPGLHLGRGGLGVGEAQDLLPGRSRRAAAAPPGRSAPGSCPSRRWRRPSSRRRAGRRRSGRPAPRSCRDPRAPIASPSAHSPKRDRWS